MVGQAAHRHIGKAHQYAPRDISPGCAEIGGAIDIVGAEAAEGGIDPAWASGVINHQTGHDATRHGGGINPDPVRRRVGAIEGEKDGAVIMPDTDEVGCARRDRYGADGVTSSAWRL